MPKNSTKKYENINYSPKQVDQLSEEDTYTGYQGAIKYEHDFRRKLSALSLSPISIDILVLRYVYDQTFSSIADELKVVSITATMKLHNEALAILKKGIKSE